MITTSMSNCYTLVGPGGDATELVGVAHEGLQQHMFAPFLAGVALFLVIHACMQASHSEGSKSRSSQTMLVSDLSCGGQ